jgi:SAM-dependent methyltransferase
MWMDVSDLRDFYASPLGSVTRRFVRRRIRSFWPDMRGYDVLGLGYATPFLSPFRESANRVVAFMPAAQGVVPWPSEGSALSSLVDEMALPLPDLAMDRVLLVHAFESAEALRPLMREVWRVMAPEGRLLVVVPNRSGMWARTERTPFGYGHPYSQRQLTRILGECMFETETVDYSLFMPPMRLRLLMRSSSAWEDAGHRFWRGFGGVLMVEACKRVTAISGDKQRVFRPVTELARGRWVRPAAGATAMKRTRKGEP